MSKTIEFRWELTETSGGEAHPVPARRLWTPAKRVTIAGTMNYTRELVIPKRNPTSPQPDPTILWEWNSREGFFEILVAEIDPASGGTLDLEWKSGAMTDDDDPSPAGTNKRSSGCSMGCSWPFILPMAEVLVNATLATAAGFDADGFSSMLTDAGTGRGRIYRLEATNPSTTDDVTVTLWGRG